MGGRPRYRPRVHFRRFATPALFLLASLFASAACSKPKEAERVTVLASLFPACDLTGRLLEADGSVHCLAFGGHDVRGGSAAIGGEVTTWAGDAKLLIVGGGVDGWVEPWAKEARKGKEIKVFRLGDRVPSTAEIGKEDTSDPYVWLDTERARLFAKALGEELARVDKGHALAIQQRATALEEKMARFDASLEPRAATLAGAKYATSRPFLGPFAERWKLALVASGPADDSEKPTSVVARAKGAGATVIVIDRTRPESKDFLEAAKAGGLATRLVDPIGLGAGGHDGSYEAFINRFFDDLSKP